MSGIDTKGSGADLLNSISNSPKRSRMAADPSRPPALDYGNQKVMAPASATQGLASMQASRAAERSFYARKPVEWGVDKHTVYSKSATGSTVSFAVSGAQIASATKVSGGYEIQFNGQQVKVDSRQMDDLRTQIAYNAASFRERLSDWQKEGRREGFFAGKNERN